MKKYVCLFFLLGVLSMGACSTVEKEVVGFESVQEDVISKWEAGNPLRTSLNGITGEDARYLSDSETFALKINETISEQMNNGQYLEVVNILECLEDFQVTNVMIRENIDEVFEQKMSSTEDEAVINMATFFVTDYFESGYYLQNYYENIVTKVADIIQRKEIVISSEEFRENNYTLESDSATITYHGDFNVWLYETTRTETNIDISDKLVLGLSSVGCDEVGPYCVGYVQNNTESTYTYLKVKGSFTNSIGEVEDVGSTYVVGSEGLAPGEKVTFTIYGNGKSSNISGCRLRIIGDVDYVLKSDVKTTTEKISRVVVKFHHTELDEESVKAAVEAYHYVDGYLISLKDDLRIVPVDGATKEEMQELSTWTEEDHMMAKAKYVMHTGNTMYNGLLSVYQLVPETFSDREAIIDDLKKRMRYDGEYIILDGKQFVSVKLNARFGNDGNYYMEISHNPYFLDGYTSADDLVKFGLYKLENTEEGDLVFSAPYGYSTMNWVLKDDQIYIRDFYTGGNKVTGKRIRYTYGEEVFTTDYSKDIPYECFKEDLFLPRPELILDGTKQVDVNVKKNSTTYFYETTGTVEECVERLRQYCKLIKQNGRHYVFDEWDDVDYFTTSIKKYDNEREHVIEGLKWKDNTLRWSLKIDTYISE